MRNNTQREKRAEARAFLNRYNGLIENVLTSDMLNPIQDGIDYRDRGFGSGLRIDKNPTGVLSDDTQDEKKNTKFNWKNPNDSDLLRILIALNVLLILINIVRR